MNLKFKICSASFFGQSNICKLDREAYSKSGALLSAHLGQALAFLAKITLAC